MLEINRYVKYFIIQKLKGKIVAINKQNPAEIKNFQSIENNSENFIVQKQVAAIEEFTNEKAKQDIKTEIIASYADKPENRRTNKWPELIKAIKKCQEENAILLIGELGTFTNNETFVKFMLDSNIKFHCCDQPFVNTNSLEVLHKHALIQKKIHGQSIKEGLGRTSAKSGNPNAAEVISKVNKPKIHTAILFADIIAPIIANYSKKGYSQRQMVKVLNEENFTAPEGGKWVLSQLQKVLDRLKLNNTVYDVREIYKELKNNNLSNSKIAEEFNNRGISPLKRTPWDEKQIDKLEERINQIEEINSINKFLSNLLPIIHYSNENEITAFELLQELENEGLQVNQVANNS